MKTITSEVKTCDVNEDNSKNIRMSLHVLQPAATDKENLVGPGRTVGVGVERAKILISSGEIEKKPLESSAKIVKKKKTGKANIGESSKKPLSVDDLTNEVPSEQYWKQLAEKRREALEETLKENEVLSQRIDILEQENLVTKQMLQEAQNLIEVLNEILEDNEDKSHSNRESETANENDQDTSQES